jgi:hypothetical protein
LCFKPVSRPGENDVAEPKSGFVCGHSAASGPSLPQPQDDTVPPGEVPVN